MNSQNYLNELVHHENNAFVKKPRITKTEVAIILELYEPSVIVNGKYQKNNSIAEIVRITGRTKNEIIRIYRSREYYKAKFKFK